MGLLVNFNWVLTSEVFSCVNLVMCHFSLFCSRWLSATPNASFTLPWRAHLHSHEGLIYTPMKGSFTLPWRAHLHSREGLIYTPTKGSFTLPWRTHLPFTLPRMAHLHSHEGSFTPPWRAHLHSHEELMILTLFIHLSSFNGVIRLTKAHVLLSIRFVIVN